MDPVTCTYINTFTNIVALAPIYRYISTKDYLGAAICTSSFAASCLMHISETKHNLPGVCFKDQSNLLLNVDRFFAVMLAVYGSLTFFKKPSINPVITFGIGTIASIIGEKTNNLTAYTVLHTIWHILSYGTLAYII